MTSNIGSDLIQQKLQTLTEKNREAIIESSREEVLSLLKKTIRPEFLNRIDEVVVFKPLTQSEIEDIVRLQIDRTASLLRENEISMKVEQDVIRFIAKAGFDPQFGARPLKRLIQRKILNVLSREILAGHVSKADKLVVNMNEGELVFSKAQ